MKCYEIIRCDEKVREACYVWNNFKAHPDDMEDLKCWVIKGTYHEEHLDQTKKCRKCRYYLALNRESGISTRHDADIAHIACSGTINHEKTSALTQVWEALKKHKKHHVVFDVTNVSNIYSCGLSMLVRMHNEARAAEGMLVVVGGRDHLHYILHSSKLSRILHLAPEHESARELFNAAARRMHEEEQAKAATARKAAEEARISAVAATPKPVPKRFVRCWEYWQNHNPRNATNCNECFHRKNPIAQACWIIEGLVEGVAFQFVNESCLDCAYFEEFGKVPHQEIQSPQASP
ncbi:MAG: STAS domain-containing protein [Chitinispirillaceae bacterium]|nr:STAS domain-containing protein [Chitinispirillaceae bacterium]